MTAKKIVVVEDEPDILDILSYNLKREGFDVSTALDGTQGLSLIQAVAPDLVLLDLMLPGIDGLEICRHLKNDIATRNIPIIMVTAKGEESDVVLGLGVGADDYVAKPFSPKELIARVKAVIRRTADVGKVVSRDCVTIDGLVVDLTKYKVTLDDHEIKLTATEFRLLHNFVSHPGQVFSREQLLDHASGQEVVIVDRNIDVHIRSIRKKLGDANAFIETIRGVGYRFKDLS